MKTTHIIPGDSAAGSLREALRIAGRDDDLLVFQDDLSCGPIADMAPSARAAWWQMDDWDIENSLHAFWLNADRADRPIVWFGQHSAREIAFRLAWAWRMAGRSYSVIDVTGLRVPVRWGNGIDGVIQSAQAVSIIPGNGLATLLGRERSVSADEDILNKRRWEKLMADNAPFRIVTADGLASAPIDHFDALLLAQATSEWKMVAAIVGNALGLSRDPYLQVGDMALHERVISLVEKGSLIADGDPSEMRACRIRLPS
ncbi:hypothetical protein ASC97_31815 [Rhizobium sp. Root1203]|uniref:DUF3658 domain-containing protein n=1 Tax=Rhizobium sp. Root1203 TaxID=1736427 RepID=UPI00070B2E0F|nr:DUF3658 domain-containing protein [Rhizobium sp. Root1203]KQV14333.1 hypothetical protein ASC97_31815 [Rhizobium sp. Root1203]